MAKLNDEAAAELPLNDERLVKKQNAQVVVALNHMNKRRDALMKQVAELMKQADELDTAIKALGGQ